MFDTPYYTAKCAKFQGLLSKKTVKNEVFSGIPLYKIRILGYYIREPLNIQRAESGEKIFCQTQQKSARVVESTRRIFVKYDGKDSVDSPCDEFLEVPLYHIERADPDHSESASFVDELN